MTAPLLVFDLDGTLVDSATDLILTLNRLLEREAIPPVALADARHLVGAGVKPLLARALAQQGADSSDANVDRLYVTYLELYTIHMVDESRPFPGVIAALDRFEAAGWRFAVCTNKLESLSRLMLDRLGLTQRFAAICGADTFPVRKPHADHLLGTIAAAGGERSRAVMVGDSAADIDVARNAAVPSVGVTFGYTPVPVAALNPGVVIDHYDELWEAVARLGVR